MQFLQICVYPQDIAGAEGPKTGMFAIFGQVLKDPKTGILTMVENCTGGKVQKWFFAKCWFICKKNYFHWFIFYLLRIAVALFESN